jgi:hypothetical protein
VDAVSGRDMAVEDFLAEIAGIEAVETFLGSTAA